MVRTRGDNSSGASRRRTVVGGLLVLSVLAAACSDDAASVPATAPMLVARSACDVLEPTSFVTAGLIADVRVLDRVKGTYDFTGSDVYSTCELSVGDGVQLAVVGIVLAEADEEAYDADIAERTSAAIPPEPVDDLGEQATYAGFDTGGATPGGRMWVRAGDRVLRIQSANSELISRQLLEALAAIAAGDQVTPVQLAVPQGVARLGACPLLSPIDFIAVGVEGVATRRGPRPSLGPTDTAETCYYAVRDGTRAGIFRLEVTRGFASLTAEEQSREPVQIGLGAFYTNQGTGNALGIQVEGAVIRLANFDRRLVTRAQMVDIGRRVTDRVLGLAFPP